MYHQLPIYRQWFENFALMLLNPIPADHQVILPDDFIANLANQVGVDRIARLRELQNFASAEEQRTTTLRNEARESLMVEFFDRNPVEDRTGLSKNGGKRLFGTTFALLRALQFADHAEGQAFFESYLKPRARLWAQDNYFEGLKVDQLIEVDVVEEDFGKKFVATGPCVLAEAVRTITEG